MALWKALVDPAYFQGNVTYYLKQRQTGAVLTEEYASRIGADRYARDAMATVRYAREVYGQA